MRKAVYNAILAVLLSCGYLPTNAQTISETKSPGGASWPFRLDQQACLVIASKFYEIIAEKATKSKDMQLKDLSDAEQAGAVDEPSSWLWKSVINQAFLPSTKSAQERAEAMFNACVRSGGDPESVAGKSSNH